MFLKIQRSIRRMTIRNIVKPILYDVWLLQQADPESPQTPEPDVQQLEVDEQRHVHHIQRVSVQNAQHCERVLFRLSNPDATVQH